MAYSLDMLPTEYKSAGLVTAVIAVLAAVVYTVVVSKTSMTMTQKRAVTLMIIGAVNWGITGAAGFGMYGDNEQDVYIPDLVQMLTKIAGGSKTEAGPLQAIVYGAVTAAAIVYVYTTSGMELPKLPTKIL